MNRSCIKARFSFSSSVHTLPYPCSETGKWEKDTDMKADPRWPKGYSMAYNVMLSNKPGIVEEEGGVSGAEDFPKLLLFRDWLGIDLLAGGGG